MSGRRFACLPVCVALCLGLMAGAARADTTLTEITGLDFGKFGMHDNKHVYTITVNPDNSYTADSAFAFGNYPARGEYLMQGLPPNDALTITIDNLVALAPQGTASPNFTIDHYTTNGPLTTDGSGNATLHVGAQLHTSGAGPYYHSDTYKGSFDLTVVF
jgi:hypothetical protein